MKLSYCLAFWREAKGIHGGQLTVSCWNTSCHQSHCWTDKAYHDSCIYQHLLELLENQSKLISVLSTRSPALLCVCAMAYQECLLLQAKSKSASSTPNITLYFYFLLVASDTILCLKTDQQTFLGKKKKRDKSGCRQSMPWRAPTNAYKCLNSYVITNVPFAWQLNHS